MIPLKYDPFIENDVFKIKEIHEDENTVIFESIGAKYIDISMRLTNESIIESCIILFDEKCNCICYSTYLDGKMEIYYNDDHIEIKPDPLTDEITTHFEHLKNLNIRKQLPFRFEIEHVKGYPAIKPPEVEHLMRKDILSRFANGNDVSFNFY